MIAAVPDSPEPQQQYVHSPDRPQCELTNLFLEQLLVDDDDEESDMSTLPEMVDTLKFSLPSAILFLLGSTVYIILAVMDLRWDDSYYYDSSQDDYPEPSYPLDPYTRLSISGPLIFIVNAMVDFSRCIYYAKNTGLKNRSLFDRDLRAGTSSVIIFGLAASVDLWVALPVDNDVSASTMARRDMLAAHLWLFSALAAMAQLDYKCGRTPVILVFVGNVMFLVGTLIDVMISYLADPDLVTSDGYILLRLGLLSSILWFVDAILYLWADVHIIKFHCSKSEVPSEVLTICDSSHNPSINMTCVKLTQPEMTSTPRTLQFV